VTTTATTAPLQDETTTAALPATTPEVDALLEQDLLVEDVSIDGMCGVY
jgi:mycofactocin precursor